MKSCGQSGIWTHNLSIEDHTSQIIIIQLIEYYIHNQKVTGSNPVVDPVLCPEQNRY